MVGGIYRLLASPCAAGEDHNDQAKEQGKHNALGKYL
jgi:hypothetical protein